MDGKHPFRPFWAKRLVANPTPTPFECHKCVENWVWETPPLTPPLWERGGELLKKVGNGGLFYFVRSTVSAEGFGAAQPGGGAVVVVDVVGVSVATGVWDVLVADAVNVAAGITGDVATLDGHG